MRLKKINSRLENFAGNGAAFGRFTWCGMKRSKVTYTSVWMMSLTCCQKLLLPVGTTSGDMWVCAEANGMLAVDIQLFWGGVQSPGVGIGSPAPSHPLNTLLVLGSGKYGGLLQIAALITLSCFWRHSWIVLVVWRGYVILLECWVHCSSMGLPWGDALGLHWCLWRWCSCSEIHMDVRIRNWSHDKCYTLTFQWFWKQWPVQR